MLADRIRQTCRSYGLPDSASDADLLAWLRNRLPPAARSAAGDDDSLLQRPMVPAHSPARPLVLRLS